MTIGQKFIIVSLLAIGITSVPAGLHASFSDSQEGYYSQNTTNLDNLDVSPPAPGEGLLSWALDIARQFEDQVLEDAADEMGLRSGSYGYETDSLYSVMLEELIEGGQGGNTDKANNQNNGGTISVPTQKVINMVDEAIKIFKRKQGILKIGMEHQLRALLTELFNNGVTGDGSIYDITYETLKVETEWACSKALNLNRLVVFEDFLSGLENIDECSGYFCYFLRFENEPTPHYDEDDDCILAHVQYLAEALGVGADNPNTYHKPVGLWGDPSMANDKNEMAFSKWMGIQWEGVPLKNGRWYDYAGALGGLYNSVTGQGDKNKDTTDSATDQDFLKDTMPGMGPCLLRWQEDNPGEDITQKVYDHCYDEITLQTTSGLLYNLYQFGEMLQGTFTWTADQIENLDQMLNSNSLSSMSICQERATHQEFVNMLRFTGASKSITNIDQEAQKLCEAMLLGQVNRTGAGSDEANAIQEQAYRQSLQTLIATIESFVAEVKNLNSEYEELLKKQPAPISAP